MVRPYKKVSCLKKLNAYLRSLRAHSFGEFVWRWAVPSLVFFVFSIQFITGRYNFANVGIQTVDLRCQKGPLYHLSRSHCRASGAHFSHHRAFKTRKYALLKLGTLIKWSTHHSARVETWKLARGPPSIKEYLVKISWQQILYEARLFARHSHLETLFC